MKTPSLILFFTLSSVSSLWSLPQDFSDLGDLALFGGGLVMDNRDLTQGFMDPGVWGGDAALPGKWRQGHEIGSKSVRYIAAAPYLFGQVPIGVEAVYDQKRLDRVSIYYLESGTFYGYAPQLKETKEGKKTLREKQALFRKVYDEVLEGLEDQLAEVTDSRGEDRVGGKTSVFKHRYRQYETGDLALQLRAKKDFFVRLDLCRVGEGTPGFVSPGLESLRKRDRAAMLKEKVQREPDGDISLPGIPMIYQGGRAYCGITTYLMAAQYLGVQMDPATMASESGFRYGMGGNKMIEAYKAAAKEGGLRLNRTTKLDFDRVKASIDAGYPVMVWRRFDIERNRLHSAFATSSRRLTKTHPVFRRLLPKELPEPDAADRATWPGKSAPAHASVITGYHPERREVIFSESWGEHARGKRMRAEELEATAYYAFYFSL